MPPQAAPSQLDRSSAPPDTRGSSHLEPAAGHEKWDGVALGTGEEGGRRCPGGPGGWAAAGAGQGAPHRIPRNCSPLGTPGSPHPSHARHSWQGEEVSTWTGDEGEMGKSCRHQTSPRQNNADETRRGTYQHSSTSLRTRPPPTPPRSSLLPSHYSLSPPGSSSGETPVHSPLGYYPWGLFTLGLAPTLSSSLQFGSDGYFSGEVLGGRAGEAERPGQAPRAQGDVEGSLQT